MIKQISIKTKLGWISAYETNGKVFKVKFGKLDKQIKSSILKSSGTFNLRFCESTNIGNFIAEAPISGNSGGTGLAQLNSE